MSQTLGARYVEQPPFDMREVFEDSSAPTPLFFVLFPGVDPGADIERLGREFGFTEENGRYVSISMGQGQEANAEACLERYAQEGGWVFLQNVHLMESWLPSLERKLELANGTTATAGGSEEETVTAGGSEEETVTAGGSEGTETPSDDPLRC